MAQRARIRRAAQDKRDKCQCNGIWEKCGAASQLEKLAINGKIRDAAIRYGHPLRKPWGSFSDVVRAALTHQVYRDLELGVRYGLNESDVELMLRTICRDHGRNKGTAKRKALKNATAAGEGGSDGNHPPSASQSPAPPTSGSREQSPTDPTLSPPPSPGPHQQSPVNPIPLPPQQSPTDPTLSPPPPPGPHQQSPTDPAPTPPPGTPTNLIPPSGTARKVKLLSTHRF